MIKAICYYRVSTERQGQSGLGLEAQRDAVQRFALSNQLNILYEYTEVESGRNNKRPVLCQAIEQCKKEQALLLIARLDRLGRNVVFISTLMESGVDFIAVDNPHANKLIVHILAAFSQHEAELISQRTILALKAAKKRGIQLGKNGKNLAKVNKAKAKSFAKKMMPVVTELQEEGFLTIRELMGELNDRKIATASGFGKWHLNTVFLLLKRINNIK